MSTTQLWLLLCGCGVFATLWKCLCPLLKKGGTASSPRVDKAAYATGKAGIASGETGQATVEAVLALPVFLLAMFVVLQAGVLARDALALHHAAREGARAAAVQSSDASIHQAIEAAAGPLDFDDIAISINPPSVYDRDRGAGVTVSLSYPRPLRVPLLGRRFESTKILQSSVTMRLESDPPPSPTPGTK